MTDTVRLVKESLPDFYKAGVCWPTVKAFVLHHLQQNCQNKTKKDKYDIRIKSSCGQTRLRGVRCGGGVNELDLG